MGRTKGGQTGNRNAMTTGIHSFLTLGRLPRGASYVGRMVRQFRQAVDAAIVTAHGETSLSRAALAQTAARHEARALLALRWMRDKADTLSPDQLLAFSKEIGNASDARDRCLKNLDLDRDTKMTLTAFYSPTSTTRPSNALPTPLDNSPADVANNAQAGRTERQAGDQAGDDRHGRQTPGGRAGSGQTPGRHDAADE